MVNQGWNSVIDRLMRESFTQETLEKSAVAQRKKETSQLNHAWVEEKNVAKHRQRKVHQRILKKWGLDTQKRKFR